MKRVQVLFTALITMFAIQAKAQVMQSPTVDEYRHMVIKGIKKSVAQVTAGKTTGTQQRLKAYANHSVASVPVVTDSAIFFYSGTKKSTFNRNEMDFRTETFNPTFDPIVDMTPYMQRTDIMENEFDSTVVYAYDTATQGLLPMTIIAVDYHAPKMPSLLSATDYASGVPETYKMICAYDNNGRMMSAKMVDPQAANDTVFARYFVYNAQGKIDHDSSVMNYMGMPMDFMKYAYEYEAGTGKLVAIRSWMGFTGAWEETSKIQLSWNGQNRIKVVTTLQWDGSAYQPAAQDSLGYNTAGDMITWRMYKEPDMNMQFADKWYQLTKLNAQGLPDTALTYGYNGSAWELESKITLSYNNFGNPTWKKEETIAGGTVTDTYEKKYYYETFEDNATAVGDIDSKNAIAVYPNPARETISVQWKEPRDTKAQVQLYNMAGQQIATQAMQLSGATYVNIQYYPAGQYLLIIKDDKGVLINRQSFIKM